MARYRRIGVALALSCGLVLVVAGCGKDEAKPGKAGAAAQPSGRKPGETNIAGLTAQLIEAKRSNGVLTVQIRFHNTTDKSLSFYPVNKSNFDAFYVTAEDKKYLVLRDEKNAALAPPVNPVGDVFASLPPGGTWIWWAKYPAPPPAVKTFSYHTPFTGPFDGIPILDEQKTADAGVEREQQALERARVLRIVGIPDASAR